jgi:hypothetical protein
VIEAGALWCKLKDKFYLKYNCLWQNQLFWPELISDIIGLINGSYRFNGWS